MQPTIRIGVGKSGRAIVDEAAALTQAHWARFAAGGVVIGVEAEATGDAQASEAVKAAFQEQFAATTCQLLDATHLAQIPDPDPSVLQVFIAASLEEVASSVAERHPTLTLRANGLWLLPEGAHACNAQ